MELFILAKSEDCKKIRASVEKYIRCTSLDSGNSDIYSYTQLFINPDDKILAIEPTIVNWNLPNEGLSRIQNLKGICTSSAWARYIDFDFCQKNRITVIHTSGANSQSVAEYAMWMMFCLAKYLPIQIQENYIQNIESPFQTELFGKTLGVIGYGNIGSRIASLGSGLGMNVIYWNRSPKQSAFKTVSLDDLVSTSDVVINCLEICPETQGILNSALLSKMKTSAYFISVLGGMGWGVQDDKYLLEMVSNHKLSGFAVENEHSGKWKDSYDGNIFIPAACAHHTREAEDRVNAQWIDGIVSVINNTQSQFKVI